MRRPRRRRHDARLGKRVEIGPLSVAPFAFCLLDEDRASEAKGLDQLDDESPFGPRVRRT